MRVIFGDDPIPLVRREGDPQRFQWVCSACGHCGNWADGFEAYSSHALDANAVVLFVVCSADCKTSSRACELKRKASELKIRFNPYSGGISSPSEKQFERAKQWFLDTAVEANSP